MKRNVFRRSISVLLAMLVALGMTSTVFARDVRNGNIIFATDDFVYVGYMGYIGAYDDWGDDDVIIKSVNSSNPAVGAVVRDYGDYFIKGVSDGRVTVTCTYSYKGQDGTISFPMDVKKVPVVFKSLKVNGKKVNLTKNPFGVSKKVPKATKVKVKAPASSQWKVKSVSAYAYKSAKDYKAAKVKVSKKAIAKGKKIKFDKKYKNMFVTVTMANKTTGETFRYTVQFYRKTAFAK